MRPVATGAQLFKSSQQTVRLAFLPETAKESVVLTADPGSLADHFEGRAFDEAIIHLWLNFLVRQRSGLLAVNVGEAVF